MRNRLIVVLAVAGLAACGGGTDTARTDSLQRDLALAPADSTAAMNDRPAATPPAATPAASTPTRSTPRPVASVLAVGTEFSGVAMDSLSSRRNHVGDLIRMSVGSDVKDAQGRTVIPSGSVVTLRVDLLGPAENDRDMVGKLRLTPTAVEIGGASRALTATVDSVQYRLVGRGVTAGDAAKVAGGAAAGAIAGRVIGGNRRGAVVGGIVGAGAGAAVASQTNDRDVVIKVGNYIRIALTGTFSKS